jgi:hypothetical protein
MRGRKTADAAFRLLSGFPAGFASPPALNNGSAFFPNLRGEFNVHQRKEELLLNNRID